MLIAMLASSIMAGCHRDGLSDEQRAVRAAATSVIDRFIGGDFDGIVADMPYAESFSADYRRQLSELLAEHRSRELSRCGGVTGYVVRGDTICGNEAHVFVQVHFGDSTSEEISIPLTRVGDEWKLR